MVQITTITIDQDIFFSEAYQKAKRERKVSRIVNPLLRSYFNVTEDNEKQEKLSDIDDQLNRLTLKKSAILKKQEQEKKKYEPIKQNIDALGWNL